MRVRRSVLAALTAGAVGVGSLVGGGVLPSVLPAGAQAGGGLVAAYSFDDGRATDVSGLGNNGTVVNASPVAGKFGQALNFNGSSSIVRIPDSASLDLTRAMTIEAWVRPSAVGGWQTIAMKENAGDLAYGVYGNSDSDGGLGMYLRGAGTTQRLNQSTSARLAANTWTHVAATYDGSTMRIYRNGNLRVSKTVAISADVSAGQLAIGGNSVWGEYFAGAIDNVRIYNRALSGDEVKNVNMNSRVVSVTTATQPTTTTAPVPTTTAPAPTTTAPVPTTTAPAPPTTTTTQPPATGTCPTGTTMMPARTAEPQFAKWPNSSNTGVPAGTCLKPMSGDLKILTSGTVIDGVDLKGCISVGDWGTSPTNVTIRRSRITGACPGGGINNFGTNLVIEDVEVNGLNATPHCITFSYYTARRVNLYGCEDGMKAGENTLVENSYIHDLITLCYGKPLTDNNYDPNVCSHNDGIQVMEARAGNLRIIGNNINVSSTVFANSAIWVNTDSGPITGVTIDRNRLEGAGFTLRFGSGCCGTYGWPTNVAVTNTVFGGTPKWWYTSNSNTVTVWTNNIVETTGATVAQ